MLHALDFAGLQRNDLRRSAGFIQCLAWLRHFHLFKTIRHKDGHFLPIEFSCHKNSLLLMLISQPMKIDRTNATKGSERLDVIQENAQRLRADSAGIFSDGILNPSICFLISLAKAAAPAPFTTR